MNFIKRIIDRFKKKECKHIYKFHRQSDKNGTFSLICVKCGYIDYGKRG